MPSGTIDSERDYVGELALAKHKSWPKITAAHSDAIAVVKMLTKELREFTSDDVDLVVFGSLARREWTSGSDVDWTMLVDGQTNADHRVIARDINNAMGKLSYNGTDLKPPGAEGVFGNMAFSHEIVHHIGGQADSNKNTTQRILLLLEATALRGKNDDDDGPFQRVVKQILNRYLRSDSNFHRQSDHESQIPRFLMNDIVRYWRTICVDFAYKDWEQDGKKWALRNIKLRTSRKILFVAGLFTVFSCFQNESLQRGDEEGDSYLLKLQSHLLNFVHASPLNIIVWTLKELGLENDCCALLDSYEKFLLEIDNPVTRGHLADLGDLGEGDVYVDETFLKSRKISHDLQRVFKKICLVVDTPLREFTFEYGVF